VVVLRELRIWMVAARLVAMRSIWALVNDGGVRIVNCMGSDLIRMEGACLFMRVSILTIHASNAERSDMRFERRFFCN